MTKISLCSYTYNDQQLLHGFLEHLNSWPRQPDEIILLDDGSEQAFSLTAKEKKLPVRLIRLETNCGFTTARHTALSAATGDIIMSFDCDIHLQGNFLDHAAKVLADKSIGLFAPSEGGCYNHDLLSEYLNTFLPNNNIASDGETNFINGAAWAIRRELWEEVGGLSGYQHSSAEDHYLCKLLRDKGLRLLFDFESSKKTTRLMPRHVFCHREWQWCHQSWIKNIKAEVSLPEYVTGMLLQARWRSAKISGEYNPTWIYFELLYLSCIYLKFCHALGSAGRIPQDTGSALWKIIHEKLRAYPKLLNLLKADLLLAGALPLQETEAPEATDTSRLATNSNWKNLAGFLGELEESLILEYLEKIGVQQLLNDEKTFKADFSCY